MSKYRNRFYRSALFLSILVTPAVFAGTVDDGEAACAEATVAELNTSLRGAETHPWRAGGRQGETLFVKLEVPSAGVLSVDVVVPGSAAVEPKLGLADSGCGVPQGTPKPVLLERSTTHLVLDVQEPGPHVFRVASQDPRQPLGDIKLRTGFAPYRASGAWVPKSGEDEEEIEIQPDPILAFGEGEDRSLHSKLHELCRSGEVDDHGDSFTCATWLSPGRDMVGEIGNGWGDDDDFFQFRLGDADATKLWTVEIETIGDLDTFGGLYDRDGQRLEVGDEGGNGANFRIARTLDPGIYFVRVGGRDGSEGSYRLRVEASPW